MYRLYSKLQFVVLVIVSIECNIEVFLDFKMENMKKIAPWISIYQIIWNKNFFLQYTPPKDGRFRSDKDGRYLQKNSLKDSA